MLKTALLAGAALLAAVPALAADVAPVPQGPQIGTWGFDVPGMNRAVKPGDDFVAYGGGTFLETLEIPADRASFGMFTRLRDLSQERTRTIIESVSKQQAAPGSTAQKVGDYYASFMDEAAIEAKGATPVRPALDAIAAVGSKSDLARLFANGLRGVGATPFPYFINQDEKAPDRYIPYFLQGGLGMPDRDYYLVDNPKFVEARAKYLEHIARMLVLGGVPAADAAAKAKGIYALEEQIAKVHWTRVDSRDSDKTYNKWLTADFAAKAPGFDWAAYFSALGLAGQAEFIVAQPTSVTGIASQMFRPRLVETTVA